MAADLAFPSDDLFHFVSESGTWAACADKPALVDSLTGQRIAYCDLGPRILTAAAALSALGFEAGEVLSIHLHNCPEFVLAFLACAALGGISTPSNPQYELMDLSHQLDNSGAVMCLSSERYRRVLAGATSSRVRMIHVIEDPHVWIHALPGALPAVREGGMRPHPDNLLVLPYSSGTTGTAKGVMLTHRAVVCNILQSTADPDVRFEINPTDTLITLLPCFHIYGLTVQMLSALARQATLVVTPKFEPQAFLRDVERHRVTLACMVPPMLVLLDKEPARAHSDLSSLRACYCGAAPLDAATQSRFAREFEVEVRQAYGTTETAPIISVATVSRARNVYGSVGRAVPNTMLKLVDEERREVALAEGGELCVRGPQLMLGYLNRPDATREAVAGGYYHTGDAAHVDAEGNLFIGDRKKDMIKVMGYQVAPAELEGLLLQHSAVADACVVGVAHEISGEVPVAFVVLADAAFDTARLGALFEQRLASYKAPHEYLVIDKVPKSASGKILRRRLRDSYREIQASQRGTPDGLVHTAAAGAPLPALWRALKRGWAILGEGESPSSASCTAPPDRASNSFARGGDSMQFVVNEFTAARPAASSEADALETIRGHVHFSFLLLTVYLHSHLNFNIKTIFAGCCAGKVLPVSAYFYALTLLDNLCLCAMPIAIVLAGVEARRRAHDAVGPRLLTMLLVLWVLFWALPGNTQFTLQEHLKHGAAAVAAGSHRPTGRGETCAAAAQHALHVPLTKNRRPESCRIGFNVDVARLTSPLWFLLAVFAWSLIEVVARRARASHLLPALALASHFLCYDASLRLSGSEIQPAVEAVYRWLLGSPLLDFVPWTMPYVSAKALVFWWLYATAPCLLPDGFPATLPGDGYVRPSSRPAVRAFWACVGALLFWRIAVETPAGGPRYGAKLELRPMSVLGALMLGSGNYGCTQFKSIDCQKFDPTSVWSWSAFLSDAMSIPLTLALVIGVCAMVPRRPSPLSRAGEQAIWIYSFHTYAWVVLDVPVALGIGLLAETLGLSIGGLVLLACATMVLMIAQVSSLVSVGLSSLLSLVPCCRGAQLQSAAMVGLLWLVSQCALLRSLAPNGPVTTPPLPNRSSGMAPASGTFFSSMSPLPIELAPPLNATARSHAMLVGCAVRVGGGRSEFLIATSLSHRASLVVNDQPCGPAIPVNISGLRRTISRYWCNTDSAAPAHTPPLLKIELRSKNDAKAPLVASVALQKVSVERRIMCDARRPSATATWPQGTAAVQSRVASWERVGVSTTLSFGRSRGMCERLSKHQKGSHCDVWAPPTGTASADDESESAILRLLCFAYARAAQPTVELLAMSSSDEHVDGALLSVLRCMRSAPRAAWSPLAALYVDPRCPPRHACQSVRRALELEQTGPCASVCDGNTRGACMKMA